MKNLKLLYLFVILLAFACSEDDDPKSSAKTITSFKFSALSPEVEGKITEDAKTIELTVPKGTSLTALVPTIVFSEKATVSPTSGTAKDFTNPVPYTVTAEDGSAQVYVVTVKYPPTPIITLLDKSSYKPGETITITGQYLKGKSSIIRFTVFISGTASTGVLTANDAGTSATFAIPANFAVGTYVITIEVDGAISEEYDDVIQVKA